MADQSMFETNQQPNPSQTSTPPNSDPFVDKLMGITNAEGKPKYKSVEDALDALAASQQFIETLKAEKKAQEEVLARVTAERDQMGSIDDFVKKLNNPAQTSTQPATTGPVDALSEDKVADILNKTLAEREAKLAQSQNLGRVITALTEKFGDKARDQISKRAQELGTTPAALKELASSNPAMALELLGGGGKPTSSSPSQSSITSIPNPNDPNPKPTWDRGAARGGLTNAELAERFRKSREYTNKRIGLEQ